MSFYTFEVLEKWSSAPLSTYFELLPPFAPCLPFVEDPLLVALSPRGGHLLLGSDVSIIFAKFLFSPLGLVQRALCFQCG